MTMNLDHILTGVTVRLAHDREQHFVDRLRVLRITDRPMIESVRAKFTVAIVRPHKYSQRDFLRIGSADSNHGETAFARWRGDRGYGVFLVHGAE